jgi:hypothetical protein
MQVQNDASHGHMAGKINVYGRSRSSDGSVDGSGAPEAPC